MWRGDSARSAESTEPLPTELKLRWVRSLPALTPTYREPRLQFDAGYEPIVLGKRMFIASAETHSVTAYNTENGEQLWRFYASAAVRCAPVAGEGRVLFGDDAGTFYAVNAADGKLLWRFNAAPTGRQVLGHGRFCSVWPVRGGPVLKAGRVYFAAGVWPFEGVFLFCLDAKTGDVVWRNEESGFKYGPHPHNAVAFGGVSPIGYLIATDDDELIVPCGQALPARFDLATGELISFRLPTPGRQPGGWFASASARRGDLLLDAKVNQDLHEGKIYQGPGLPGVRNKIRLGEKEYKFADAWPGVKGPIHSMLAADGKLFVVSRSGQIYCFGKQPTEVRRHALSPTEEPLVDTPEIVTQALSQTLARTGYLWLPHVDESATAWIESLLQETAFHVVVSGTSEQIQALRKTYVNRLQRLSLIAERDGQHGLPPYFASLVFCSQPLSADAMQRLRPYGGVAMCGGDAKQQQELRQSLGEDAGFDVQRNDQWLVTRRGQLVGASNYTGDWSSPDALVRAPLGLLWYDDALGHFKRSPQPWFVDGLMVSYPKEWMEAHTEKRRPPYDLAPPVYSDVYTGRVLAVDDLLRHGEKIPKRDRSKTQPSQYRPPQQKDDWRPEQPVVGVRTNPLTGLQEPRAIPKSYGCDGGNDYGNLYTMRSGTPAFYDKRVESGVCSISGPRSGCTNSIIPACGLLNAPYFYEGCTCSYPLPLGLALAPMPPTHEQWASWGEGKAENIVRLGLNLGAPGDRMTEQGTLWLDYPSRGGPSPEIDVTVAPDSAKPFYRHSAWMKSGPMSPASKQPVQTWPWVAASGIEGASTITIAGLKPGEFKVHLTFADTTATSPNERVMNIRVNDRLVAEKFDIVAAAGGSLRSCSQSITVASKGQIKIDLESMRGTTLISGVELVATDK